MTLDDLLIYGDWLEENDIKNILYKQFLNLLRIKLRKNTNYDEIEEIDRDNPLLANYMGGGYGDGLIYGDGWGNTNTYYGHLSRYGGSQFGLILNIRNCSYGGGWGNGFVGYGDDYGNGESI